MSVQITQCLKIIEILAIEPSGIAIRDIATAANVTKSGAHRILTTLVQTGYIIQNNQTQDYMLSSKLPLLGLSFSRSKVAIREIQPILDRLALMCEELVQVTLFVDSGLYWIAAAEGAKRGLRFTSNIGNRAQLTPTAVGQALLSALPEEDAIRLVLTEGFGPSDHLGPNAPRDLNTLKSLLECTRKNGFAVVVDSAELGVSAVASPVFSPDKENVIGTLGIAAPTARKSEADLNAIGEMLAREAPKFSISLSYALESNDVGRTVIPKQTNERHRSTIALLE